MTHKIHCKWFWRYLLWAIWQQQTAADAHRQLLLADAIACGSSLSCYSVVDGITMMAADAAAAMAFLTMETAVAALNLKTGGVNASGSYSSQILFSATPSPSAVPVLPFSAGSLHLSHIHFYHHKLIFPYAISSIIRQWILYYYMK